MERFFLLSDPTNKPLWNGIIKISLKGGTNVKLHWRGQVGNRIVCSHADNVCDFGR